MPQYAHNRFLFFEFDPKTIVSLSAPVDVIVPFDVVAVIGSGDTIIVFVFELLHIPELDIDDEPKPPLPLFPLMLLRATRLFALAVIRRLRSSRSNDFNGDTFIFFIVDPKWHNDDEKKQQQRQKNEMK